MKALGVALAVCSAAVLWPNAAHANPIGASAGAITCALGAQISSGGSDSDEVATIHHSEAIDEDDATFTRQTALDHSIRFANSGSVEAFADDRTSLGDDISVEGLGVKLHKELTISLRKPGHGDQMDHPGEGGHAPKVPKLQQPEGGGGTSATPEPASLLLLGSGLVVVACFRRQLFA